MQLDLLSPAYLGEDRISVQLSDPDATPTAMLPISVDIGYDACEPEGVVLPIDVVVTNPAGDPSELKTFRRSAPRTFTFTPTSAGSHLVLVREQAHNRWIGRLTIDVEGDEQDRDPNVRI